MDRKNFLKMITVSTGAALIGGEFILGGCQNPKADNSITFSTSDTSLLSEVAETIIPATKTPGAKEAEVVKFMQNIVKGCYFKQDQKVFKDGIKALEQFTKTQINKGFMQASPKERKNVLQALDSIARDYEIKKYESEQAERKVADLNRQLIYHFKPNHYFTMMKQLTITGYFTSQIGMTKALKYLPIPGKWIGEIEYKKGDKDWAIH